MSRKARWTRRRWLAGSAIVIILCVLFVLRMQKRILGEFVTPDGAYRIRVLQIGGANLSYHPDSRLYELFSRTVTPWLPKAARSWLPAIQNVDSQADPTKTLAEPLQILFEVIPENSANKTRPPFGDLARPEFVSRDGYRYADNVTGWRHHGPGRTTLSIANFPRRDRTLTMHVIGRVENVEWARLELPNPIPAIDAPQWTPQPVPAVVTTPEFDCRLMGLERRADHRGYDPKVEVVAKSPAWNSNFTVTRLEDATGNFGRVLSPFETAWKVRVDVCRTADGEFEPDEIWELPPVPLPKRGTVATLDLRGRVGNTLIKATCLKGAGMGGAELSGTEWVFSTRPRGGVQIPGQRRITYGTINTISEEPFLQLDLKLFGQDSRLYATLVDQDGEVVGRLTDTTNTRGRYAWSYYRATVAITPKPTSREISGRIIITKPSVVEFLVAPPAELKALHEPTAKVRK